MSNFEPSLFDFGQPSNGRLVDGLVPVIGYNREGRPPEEVLMMEKAQGYGATAVFFEAGREGRPSVAQAFVFVSDGPADDQRFAEKHQRLWSWGGVPLVYRKTRGLVQLFRCAHKPDFVSSTGQIICKPYKRLRIAADISSDPWWDATTISTDPWWDATRLRNGTLWDDPSVCKAILSPNAAHKSLIDAVKSLNAKLNDENILKKHLRRRLLILSLLIAYLEERKVFLPNYFGRFLPGAEKFFQVLADGKALVKLLKDLNRRFNGGVFVLDRADQESLAGSGQLSKFARLIQARRESNGQLTLWQLYSFKDLPVELISHIYQLFVVDEDTSVYTPPFLVRLMLDEVLTWDRIDRLHKRDEIILDPSCGSGVFLVEAYKKIVLHWRSRNNWKRPSIPVLKELLNKVHGVDLEEGAVELAAFSLCLALCDALEPAAIRSSIRLFPTLTGLTLHRSCFFEAKEKELVRSVVGVIVGNPPFASKLNTPGAERSYQSYEDTIGALPDKQLGYLFLHESMGMIAADGVLCMLQQYNFLYNQQSLEFRRHFFTQWDVREILDFISVRGLFQKGGADTKVIVMLAEAAKPHSDRKILHAVFRRSGRVNAEQGFDIDYYDLHWMPRHLVLSNDRVWRANLLGGGRVLGLTNRLVEYRTLGNYAENMKWDYGEGFIEGKKNVSRPADHIVGKRLLPSEALTSGGINRGEITYALDKPVEGPRSEKRFTPPLLLVREQMDLPHAVWKEEYLTYKNQIVGFAAPVSDEARLDRVDQWLTSESVTLQAFVAATSVKLFTQKSTTLSGADILAIPYPQEEDLDLGHNERVVVNDIVDYYRDLVRLGEDSTVMNELGFPMLPKFNKTFVDQVNAVYKHKPLLPLKFQRWPGVVCQPFVFGDGIVDWSGAEELRGKLTSLLHEQSSSTLHITRIARIYDGNFVFLLKPDRLRYWLRSVALRDADETLSDLRTQGF